MMFSTGGTVSHVAPSDSAVLKIPSSLFHRDA